MQITINKQGHELPPGATLADALLRVQPRPPFAAAINLEFVPKSAYADRQLADGDRIEIISPVTGG